MATRLNEAEIRQVQNTLNNWRREYPWHIRITIFFTILGIILTIYEPTLPIGIVTLIGIGIEGWSGIFFYQSAMRELEEMLIENNAEY